MAKTDKEIDWERNQLILHYAADSRKFEIQLFWQRSLYFWGMVAASLVAFATLHKGVDAAIPHHFCVLVICFGFLTSFAWALQCRGGKYWHEAWEQKVHESENEVLKIKLFWKEEPLLPRNPKIRDGWLRARRYSVTKIAIAMADFSILAWAALATMEAKIDSEKVVDWFVSITYGATIVLSIILAFTGKSKPTSEH